MAQTVNLPHRDFKITMNKIFKNIVEKIEKMSEQKKHFINDIKLLREPNILDIKRLPCSSKGS